MRQHLLAGVLLTALLSCCLGHPLESFEGFQSGRSIFPTREESETVTQWDCATLSTKSLFDGVTWTQLNCTCEEVPFWGFTGPAIVNVVEIDVTMPGVALLPLQAPVNTEYPYGLAPINAIAAASDFSNDILAGINGGYFWRLDSDDFVDSVCEGKSRANASEPASEAPGQQNLGVGDGTLVVANVSLSNNCNCTGYNRPTVLSIPDDSLPYITILSEGAANPIVTDAIGAGPNMVSWNTSAGGSAYVNIPKDDENIGNILEHSANTAVGLSPDAETAYFVTFDGADSCGLFDPSCGFNAFQLAYFMKDYLNVGSAMGMDQGGSTTMYVAGEPNDGIVTNPGQEVRSVYNGLFVYGVPGLKKTSTEAIQDA